MNINDFVKLLNTNNDSIIQKNEIDYYKQNNFVNCIFDDYLNTINNDIGIDDFIVNFNESKAFKKESLYQERHRTIQNETLKTYSEINDGWPIGTKDARGQNISALELTEDELINLCVDSTTIMNDKQREIITRNMAKMQNPGLGEDYLHSIGITGKNTKIAIIDSQLSYNEEIDSQIIHYEDLTKNKQKEGSFHMNTVASVAVGKKCGVAPDAKLICYAADTCKEYQKAIKKIIKQNKVLKKEGKPLISVISISCGFDMLSDYQKNYKALADTIQIAKNAGIAVITCDMNIDNKNRYPVGANPCGDINSPENYKIWKYLSPEVGGEYYQNLSVEEKDKILLIPGEHRTVAGQYNDYRHDGAMGGESWTVPYLAGVFAQAKQVNPSINWDEFYQIALETADKCYNYDDKMYIGKLLNPVKIIEKIRTL